MQEGRKRTFLVTFAAYASIHITRTTWSNSKPYVKQQLDCPNWYLGVCDSLFMLFYSIGLLLFGTKGDHMDLKIFLGIGMVGVMGSEFLIGVSGFASNSILFVMLPVAMSLCGLFECSCWPGVVACMGNWFGQAQRGFLMSLWVGCKNMGDLMGFMLMGQVILNWLKLSWSFCFLLVSLILLGSCFSIYRYLEPYPEKLGLEVEWIDQVAKKDLELREKSPDKRPDEQEERISRISRILEKRDPRGLQEIFKIPGVSRYALIFLCLKCTQYGILFWLPSYLHSKGLKRYSPFISSMFPIGSWIGGIVQGHISDLLQQRAIVMAPSLLISSLLMFIVNNYLSDSPTPYYLIIFLVGFTLGGPYNNVASVCSNDLARQPILSGQPKVLSGISALLEASAVIGASLFQILLSETQSYAFYIFTLNSLITFILLIPMSREEYHKLYAQPLLQ